MGSTGCKFAVAWGLGVAQIPVSAGAGRICVFQVCLSDQNPRTILLLHVCMTIFSTSTCKTEGSTGPRSHSKLAPLRSSLPFARKQHPGLKATTDRLSSRVRRRRRKKRRVCAKWRPRLFCPLDYFRLILKINMFPNTRHNSTAHTAWLAIPTDNDKCSAPKKRAPNEFLCRALAPGTP